MNGRWGKKFYPVFFKERGVGVHGERDGWVRDTLKRQGAKALRRSGKYFFFAQWRLGVEWPLGQCRTRDDKTEAFNFLLWIFMEKPARPSPKQRRLEGGGRLGGPT
jgi:hypothetical protein